MGTDMVTLNIDGKDVTVDKDSTILDAARKLDLTIPSLCHNPDLIPFGGCRLCLVEVTGTSRPVASCAALVQEGMKVKTSSNYLERLRRTNVELLLSDHPNDCMLCERAGNCKLQELAYYYGIRENRFEGENRKYPEQDQNPFIRREMEKCIMCGQCVRICDEIQGVGAIDFAYKGLWTKVCPPFEKDLDCEFCGQCVAVCPTGALTGRMWASKGRQKFREVDTVCPYCGCGCNLTLAVKKNEIARIYSRKDSINQGMLCVKGRFAYDFVNSPDRLTKPLIRTGAKKDFVLNRDNPYRESKKGHASRPDYEQFREASWEEALDLVALRLKEIKDRHGPDVIGGLASARCTNEDNYLFQKFMRMAVGTNNVDHCARY
ncbi:NADH:ubiquinone oxidoreductase, subunit G, iron-sulfur binding [Desulfonatronospira thiodismutans ASO3-1]|uniref:NADH:ubiquinone oxidoreductase, subunit G, iron-sulfur binding n=1 Tax=Desulfonatronospira thiodismutans ASO3-1 TaxID=555779 RepID=D6SM84_9BACT|nr:NADH:ubiquinone oxidoreductase, subunit G, iron-sulfur binding [Desulfonatronospira thiodismutans ASO3-1]